VAALDIAASPNDPARSNNRKQCRATSLLYIPNYDARFVSNTGSAATGNNKAMLKYLIIASLCVLMAACGAKPPLANAVARQPGPVSTEVKFKGADGFELEGTFEAPADAKACPALLLLPGSGPTDRDGNSKLLTVKVDILKQIADRLAAAGYATLRFDKRAIAHYQAAWPKGIPELAKFFSWRHFVEDAEAALTYLRGRPEVDPKRVGMLGHSEGALISLQVASEIGDPPVALVLVGSTGRRMGQVLHDQIAQSLAKNNPNLDPKPYIEYTDAACAALAAGKPLPPDMPAGLASLFNPVSADIMGAYCRIDPTDLAKTYPGPVLAINGQDDTQVSAIKDTPALVSALKRRSKGSVDVMIVPKASHCLKSTADGNMDAFAGPVDPRALEKIVAWLAMTMSKA
jgi:dienelactone hydrolase